MLNGIWRDYLRALLSKDKERAWRVVANELAGPVSTERIYLDLIAPAQRRLAELVRNKRISPGDEKIATAVTEFIVSRLYLILVKHAVGLRRALVVCSPSSSRELGARVMADFLESDGWRVRMLGVGHRKRDIVRSAECFRPRAVFLCPAFSRNWREDRTLAVNIRKAAPKSALFAGGDYFLASWSVFDRAARAFRPVADAVPRDALEGVMQARHFLEPRGGAQAA
ncbi:MAG: cobalamin B12-binding domain-containing protein [Candidatus Omnitrophica bacterium]|nr:cobalamin B12-binding domain-containing protein [Candidatus Omnitrophota bacterium]